MFFTYEYSQPFNITMVMNINGETAWIKEAEIYHEEGEGSYWTAEHFFNSEYLPAGEYEFIIISEGKEKAKTTFTIS